MNDRIESALAAATDTRELRLGPGAIRATAEVFRPPYGGFAGRPALVFADSNTFEAAGRSVLDVLRAAGLPVAEPVVLDDPDLHAHLDYAIRLEAILRQTDAIAVAVGSGTINDLAKLASHRAGRSYLVVATAASMDGYTSFGASITSATAKETFYCPAPRAVVADLDVIAAAPPELNAAGYADLLAKTTAGADWILADALGVEPVHRQAWSLVQDDLRQRVSDPEGVRHGDREAIANLTEGLLMGGFAMQAAASSRPASGAEHQFSHLWDMQDHRHEGRIPYHGYKVGIGTLASARLYEWLFAAGIENLDVGAAADAWPDEAALERLIERTHASPTLRAYALQECRAKHLDRAALVRRLERLKAIWPELRPRLQAQLLPSETLRRMLRQVGAPVEPAEIGIDLPRFRRSHIEAQQIRRRYTVLDLATEAALLPAYLDRRFRQA